MIDTCAPQGVTLLGNEMLQWTDAESSRPAAGSPVLCELIASVSRPGTRALVVGPHSEQLVEAVAAGCAEVTLVLRSMPDARTLARRYADRPEIAISCGTLEKIGSGPFDVIVALDGLDRVLAADAADLGWQARLSHLAALLVPGGSLLVGMENDLGTHRLVGLPDPEVRNGDEEWRPTHGVDASRPTSPVRLDASLAKAGLVTARRYAAYPTPSTPAVLVPCDGEDTGRLPAAVLAGVLASSCDAGLTGQPLLADPRWMVRAAAGSDITDVLAPAWIAVCGPARDLPDVLVCDGAGEWAVTYELTADGGRRARTAGLVTLGNLTRDTKLLNAPAPVGQTLDELLRHACARADLPGIRELLRDYADWLHKHAADGMVAGAALFATADNVVLDAGGWTVADPSWSWAAPLPVDQVLARSLRRFVVRLLFSGQRHPWPSYLDAARLCETVHAMAGYPASGDLVERGLELEAEVVSLQEGVERSAVAERIRDPLLMSGMVRDHRALVAAHARLCDDLRVARERAEWADRAVTKWRSAADKARAERRRALRRLKVLRESGSYRLGNMITKVPRRIIGVIKRK